MDIKLFFDNENISIYNDNGLNWSVGENFYYLELRCQGSSISPQIKRMASKCNTVDRLIKEQYF